jgi:hypothetical protein
LKQIPPLKGLNVKLPAYRAGLPGNEISFLIVPLDPLGLSTPPTKRSLRGTCRQRYIGLEFPYFLEKTVVLERTLLKRWGTYQG